MTGKTTSEVAEVLQSLFERGKIKFDGSNINKMSLYWNLNAIMENEMTISDRIAKSIYENNSFSKHMGMVELVPYENGVAVTEQSDFIHGSFMWSKELMIKLANEILVFANSINDSFVDEYNNDLNTKLKKQKEIDLQREKARAEEKKKSKIPKHGFIILIRFPNGTYKFTYTTSLLLEQKIFKTKEQFGDNIQVVHSLETYDTTKFYNKFLKNQFSNRLVGKEKSVYQLTDEDVEYIKNEKFPSNAMEWFEGPIPVEN